MTEKKSKSPVMMVEKEVLKSKAWLSLGGFAPQLYMLFLLRRRMEKIGRKGHGKWVCTNVDELIFPYREAEKKFGITQPRFTRAIDMLVDQGFIDIVEHGIGTARVPTKYGLSERWRKYDTPAFEPKPREPIKRGWAGTRKRNKSSIQKRMSNSI